MLVVKVDIWPGGSENDRFELGELVAENISELDPVSSYQVRIRQNDRAAGGPLAIEMRIDGHRREDGFWPLVHKALTGAVDAGCFRSESEIMLGQQS